MATLVEFMLEARFALATNRMDKNRVYLWDSRATGAKHKVNGKPDNNRSTVRKPVRLTTETGED